MIEYINAIKAVSDNVKCDAHNSDILRFESKLQVWNRTTGKHTLHQYFDNSLFGACYAAHHFERKAQIFYDALKFVGDKDNRILNIIKSSKKTVSFGCGPGPEIAAYVHYVRNYLGCKLLFLNIVAVDKLKYWKKYITMLQDVTDNLSYITFENKQLNSDYLKKMDYGDVCIMSFAQGMNFSNIWKLLKSRFHLIIFIDLLDKNVQDLLESLGFKTYIRNSYKIYSYVNEHRYYCHSDYSDFDTFKSSDSDVDCVPCVVTDSSPYAARHSTRFTVMNSKVYGTTNSTFSSERNNPLSIVMNSKPYDTTNRTFSNVRNNPFSTVINSSLYDTTNSTFSSVKNNPLSTVINSRLYDTTNSTFSNVRNNPLSTVMNSRVYDTTNSTFSDVNVRYYPLSTVMNSSLYHTTNSTFSSVRNNTLSTVMDTKPNTTTKRASYSVTNSVTHHVKKSAAVAGTDKAKDSETSGFDFRKLFDTIKKFLIRI